MDIGAMFLLITVLAFVLVMFFSATGNEPERHGIGGGKLLPTCHAIEQGKRCVRMHCDVHHTVHHLHIEDLDHAA